MRIVALLTVVCATTVTPLLSGEAPMSSATEECIACHGEAHPGIVADWKTSRHAMTTVGEALKKPELERRVSGKDIPENLLGTSVGCAECHTIRPGSHADTFEHEGYQVHVVVSPDDCRTCHPIEAEEYQQNIMSQAYGNLASNAVYAMLEHAILGKPTYGNGKLTYHPADENTKAETCYYCHGTKLAFKGLAPRETELLGEMELPVIEGWPNQGVGRINLDGSKGACTACHPRHAFSIEVARKPHTCRECHIGPDAPAYKVYAASKHGNIYASKQHEWDFDAVPWQVGKHFTAPTCATCHMSLLSDSNGEQLVARSHSMGNRMPWRLFGLIYAHAHPKSPDTTKIRNSDGLPLPTTFLGAEAEPFLVSADEKAARQAEMGKVCAGCHSGSWIDKHWERLEHTIKETNNDTLQATKIMVDIWKAGLAEGLAKGGSPFDEYIERTWSRSWLIYANTIRFASAMGGGGDYAVFADGRYMSSHLLTEMVQWLSDHTKEPDSE